MGIHVLRRSVREAPNRRQNDPLVRPPQAGAGKVPEKAGSVLNPFGNPNLVVLPLHQKWSGT